MSVVKPFAKLQKIFLVSNWTMEVRGQKLDLSADTVHCLVHPFRAIICGISNSNF
jgi:hypothetical protein